MRPTITESITPYDFNTGIDLGEGFAARRAAHEGRHNARVLAAARLIVDVQGGRTDPLLVKEAFNPTKGWVIEEIERQYPGLMLREAVVGGMSISDFPMLNLDVLDRAMYGTFTAMGSVSGPMMRKTTLRDFRNVSRYIVDGATTPPEAVAPGAQPKEKVLTPGPLIQYAPLKYESFTRVVWEALINDDLGAFDDLAKRLTLGAWRGIELAQTGLYIDVNGPSAAVYTAGNKNIINIANGAMKDNPSLDIDGLAGGLTVLDRMLDFDGFPIMNDGDIYLWYGSALETTVQNLMHMLTVDLQVNGGTGNALGFPTQFVRTTNWLVQRLKPIKNPFMRMVATAATGTIKDTMWGLTINPASVERPAFEFGFLRGFESPQIFSKAPNTMRAGAGLDASLGDFYTMAQEMKVLTVYGGKFIDGHTTVASTGANV